jgi:hypothetical protein
MSEREELMEMLACKECGELEHIYFKHVYHGFRDSVWIVECQQCYSLVPVVSYQYCPEEMTAAWNGMQARAALKQEPVEVSTIGCALIFHQNGKQIDAPKRLYAAPPDLEQRLKEAEAEISALKIDRDAYKMLSKMRPKPFADTDAGLVKQISELNEQLTAANEKYIILKVAVEQAVGNYDSGTLLSQCPLVYYNLKSALPTEGEKNG